MKDTLKKLYFDRLGQSEQNSNEKSDEHLMHLSEQESELLQTLTPVQQKQLRAFLNKVEELHCDAEMECFMDGFKLGIRLILAAVSE